MVLPTISASLIAFVDQAGIIYGDRYSPPSTTHREAFARKYFEKTGDPAQFIVELREFIESTSDAPDREREANTPSTAEFPHAGRTSRRNWENACTNWSWDWDS